MRRKKLKQRQDELRRANKAYTELAQVGGYLDHAIKLISLQYLVGSMVDVLSAEIEITLERANMKTSKIISIQNSLRKATDAYYKYFEGAMEKEAIINWASDLDELERVLFQFAGIKTLRPKRKAMREAKKEIEDKYSVELEDLK